MKIETYEAISLDEQNGDVINELVSEEALALIETLDLDGQRSLVVEREAGGETVATRNPYRLMTAEEQAVYSAILPRRVSIESYSDGPIPLRVLQVAGHAKTLFERLVIWCPERASDPDPLLVGLNGTREWDRTIGREIFILARWGDVLEPMDTLREKARSIIRAKVLPEIAEAKANLASLESTLDAKLELYLRTGKDASEHFSLSFAR